MLQRHAGLFSTGGILLLVALVVSVWFAVAQPFNSSATPDISFARQEALQVAQATQPGKILAPQLRAKYARPIAIGQAFLTTEGPRTHTPQYGDGKAPLITQGQWWNLQNNITFHPGRTSSTLPNVKILDIRESTGSTPLTIKFELSDHGSGKVLEKPTLVYDSNGIPQHMICELKACPGGGRWLSFAPSP